jgi:hypothetical protein
MTFFKSIKYAIAIVITLEAIIVNAPAEAVCKQNGETVNGIPVIKCDRRPTKCYVVGTIYIKGKPYQKMKCPRTRR